MRESTDKQEYFLQYGTEVAVIPAAALAAAKTAGREELLVLLLLAEGAHKSQLSVSELAARAGLDTEKVRSAIAFWRGAGILTVGKTAAVGTASSVQKNADAVSDVTAESASEKSKGAEKSEKKLQREAALPHYTGDELADILEKRKEAAVLIDACQRALGRLCNPHEINVILGLSDYLRLEDEYILLLVNYCVKNGKKTLRYIEKVAFSLYDSDISDVASLTAWMERNDTVKNAEGELRTMLGIGARALTGKETGLFARWLCDFGFSIDVIRMAYEITVNAGKNKVMDYMNGILERWHADGLDTPEKITAEAQARAASRGTAAAEAQVTDGGSFSTEDFFDAALRRSLGGAYEQVTRTTQTEQTVRKEQAGGKRS